MIDIHLKMLGNLTEASCTIPLDNGGEATFSKIASSGAKALISLVEALCKDYKGYDWKVVSNPRLSGTVPGARYRKPSVSRKKRQAQQLRWC